MSQKADFIAVDPVSPPAAYIGGKRQLARLIGERIAAVPHSLYAEPFVGMGGVFFRRTFAPRAEFINDRSKDVANLFRILQRHYPQLMDTLRFQITSRADFERLTVTDPDTLTDLERAARFIYLQRLTFGGKVAGRSFGVNYSDSSRFNLTTLAPLLQEVHERLASVVIENLDWHAFIDRYDRPETLFYLDPPYWGTEGMYGKELFGRDQFKILAERLGRIKGRFILSINDVPEIRSIFSAFDIEDVDLTYTAGGGKGKAVKELIIMNGA
ncbi:MULTISPECIES: DNA adenine methylase [unclassified Brucella]|uniref:DNA adenine methylase n=1 Tax=unclassified Brucella TaxID=2632610 RepID=UPI0009727EFE|nr:MULTISPECIES: DNA adenine methylase [unclassified Brucella]APX70101.1 DNA methyltransferase [Brucella sp. 09RB8471]MRN42020.1 DNA adenine methylase [Brucella sp. 09RB8913]MRN59388.1 DNA adenine methylase [Brucella sp. 09RB8918]MRN79230.1 DNA adenine methylase [Brucella sp. 10RB9210]CAB4327457.1 Modification methylase DpnIIA [Brucella sp. 191011898]